MRPACFAVDETAVCIHDPDVSERNREFLEGVDCSYFTHVADVHGERLEGESAQVAAVSLRAAYSHGLEAFFAFVGALVQAPDCVYGWLGAYKNRDLKSLISKIHNYRPVLYSRLVPDVLDWDHLSEGVHQFLVLPDVDHNRAIREGFALLWRRFAGDLLDQGAQIEYNSIKHGCRVRPGGFSFAFGEEKVPGVPCPPHEMHSMGGSKYGSSFFALEPIVPADRINFRSRRTLRNWSPANFADALHLIAMSINNVVGRLRIHAGVHPATVRFLHPIEIEAFDAPWREMPATISSAMDYQINPLQVQLLDREQVLGVYSNRRSEPASEDQTSD